MKRLILIALCLALLIPSVFTQTEETTSGTLITLQIPEEATPDENILIEITAALSRRLDIAGVEEFDVRATASGSIMVALHGELVENVSDDALNLLTEPGFVEFVDFSGAQLANPQELTGSVILTDAQVERYAALDLPSPNFETVLTGDHITAVAVQNMDASGESASGFADVLNILSGQPVEESDPGRWIIVIEFDDDGAQLMEDYTSTHIGEPLAIVLDGLVLSVPIVQAPLSSSAVITGNFTQTEAGVLASQLSSGALPLPLTVESVSTYYEYNADSTTSAATE